MNTDSILNITNLNKKFKGFKLNIQDLSIPKGFATALIGENGAGKSTLINILAGIRLDYNGTLEFFGGEKDEKNIRENVGYTGTSNYFMPHWTIKQIGDASELLFDTFDKSRFFDICNEIGVIVDGGKKNKGISKLSDGMRMKVILANVFARETKLLLLDEPASPLDPLMRDKLCEMIRDYIDRGNGEKSVLFSTHNIADMENVTDYAIIMNKGSVVEQGFVEELKEKYILVKGDKEDMDKVKDILFSYQENRYGFEGLCISDDIDKLVGLNVSKEIPTLYQISIAVMRKYTQIEKLK